MGVHTIEDRFFVYDLFTCKTYQEMILIPVLIAGFGAKLLWIFVTTTLEKRKSTRAFSTSNDTNAGEISSNMAIYTVPSPTAGFRKPRGVVVMKCGESCPEREVQMWGDADPDQTCTTSVSGTTNIHR
jgi:hypothetical protein